MRQLVDARIWKSIAALLTLLLALLTLPLTGTPTKASGDSLTLNIRSLSSFFYGGCVQFDVILTLGTPITPPTNVPSQVPIQVSNGQSFFANENSSSATGTDFTYFVQCPLDSAGQVLQSGSNLTAFATFTNPVTNMQTKSNLVTFSITPVASSTSCSFVGYTHFAPMTQMQIVVSLDGQTLGGQKYTFTFEGPVTVTSPPLTIDANGVVYVQTPSEYGIYLVTCTYLGDSNHVVTSYTNGRIIVSQDHPLGRAQLYSNPPTLAANQAMQLEVDFIAAPGGPTPTGFFDIQLSPWTGTIVTKVGPNGVTTGTTSAISNLSGISSLTVWYSGDGYYKGGLFKFPLTNPPIPGTGSGSGSGGRNGAIATNTPAIATATVDESATPSTSPTPTPPPSAKPRRAVNATVLWALGGSGTLLLVLGTGMGVPILLRRRKLTSLAP